MLPVSPLLIRYIMFDYYNRQYIYFDIDGKNELYAH